MAEKNDSFRDNASSFFKRLQQQDLIKVGDGKVTSLSQPADKDELKRRSEFTVFRQYLQQKNWSTKHLELFNEYRKMDESFPIINAALRLYCHSLDDTKIPLLNGEVKTLRELVDTKVKDFYVWSYDPILKKIVPAKCKEAVSTGFKKVLKLVLDDGTEIKCTHDHKQLLTNGNWVETKDLKPGDSLQSIYERKNVKGYLELSDGQFCKNNKKKLKWKKAHSIIANEVDFLIEQKNNLEKNKFESKRDNIPVCHHKSFNKLNNAPNKLEWLLWEDHRQLHQDRYDITLNWNNLSEKDKQIRIEKIREANKLFWSDPEKSAAKALNHSDKMKEFFAKMTKQEIKDRHNKFQSFDKNHNWWGRDTNGKNNPNADLTKKHFEDFTIYELNSEIIKHGTIESFCKSLNCTYKTLKQYKEVKNETEFAVLAYASLYEPLKIALLNKKITQFTQFKAYVESNFEFKNFEADKFTVLLKRKGFLSLRDFYSTFNLNHKCKTNHKVISIIDENETIEVGDIVNSGEHHNFAIKCKEGMMITHNSQEICLSGDTILHTPMGDKSILELYNSGKNKSMFFVHTVDLKYKRTQWGMAKYIKYNGKKPVYEVIVDRNIDSETALEDKILIPKFKCTENHKIMLPDGSFKMLNELKVGDNIFSFYKYTDPSCRCKVDKFQYSRILSINLIGEEDVYDLVSVEPFSHFSIKLTDSFYVQVHNCTKDDDGNVIKIHSKDKAIKESLEECFFKNLKINSQAYLLVKEMIKFGNLYCYQNVRKGEGVTDLVHMPPEAIRIELLTNAENLDDFKYTWFGQSGGGMQFEPWEIVHFKNIEDISSQPYGTSILRSVVDTWRRIILMREALIIYRITRAPQRYLFKIDTTGMDPDAAILFSEEVKKQLYKNPMVNPITGEIDFKYNPLSIEENFYMPTFEGDVGGIEVLNGACLKGDTIILTNLGSLTIKELSDNWLSNQKLFVLSSNKYGYITPGKVLKIKETKQTNNLFKIEINGNKYEESTDNHPFLLETLLYKRADDLEVGDKLKGMYEKEYIVTGIELVTYEAPETVYDLEVEEYHNFALASGVFVHNSNLGDVEDYKIIKDDLFAGLLIPKSYLTFEEDLCLVAASVLPLLDGKNKTLIELEKDFNNGIQNYVYSSDENGNIKPGKILWVGSTKKVKTTYEIELDNEEIIECSENHPFRLRDGSYKRADELVVNESIMPLYRKIIDGYEHVWNNGKQKWQKTHQMVSLGLNENFYKKEADGDKRICHHKDFNKLNNHPDNLMNVSQKKHIQLHKEIAFKNLCSIESRKKVRDIQQTKESVILHNHKVKSIRIKEYEIEEQLYDLHIEEYHNFALSSGVFVHNSNKAALAQEDMRFAGAIKQYQGNFIEGLLHIAIVHLNSQGFSVEDLENFEIEMNTNSKLLKKLENETLQQKVDLAKSILDTSNGELTLMSYTQVLKDVMKFSDEEISQAFENQLVEKKINWRLSQLKEQGFYEEPAESKKQEMLDRIGENDIFSKLQFEGIKKTDVVGRILNEKVKEEISKLSKTAKGKPTKQMINKLIDLNPSVTEISKVRKDIGLRD